MTRVRGCLATVGAVALVATACSNAPASSPAPEPSPGHTTITLLPETVPRGINISFTQQRLDEGTRKAQVRVANGTDQPLRVTAVGIAWAGFPGDVQPIDYTVPAQGTIDLRYRLPRADCSTSAAGTPMRGTVVTARRTITRPMSEESRRFLERLHSTACVARKIATSVRAAWDVSGHTNDGLVLTRTQQADPVKVTVEQVQGSVLFDLTVRDHTVLPVDQRRTRVPIELSPGRCDEHARSQSTQTFLWRVWLRFGDDSLLPLVLEPPLSHHGALLAWLDEACAGYTGH